MSAFSTQPNTSTLVFDHHLGAFTDAELDAIEQYCDSLLLNQGTLGHGVRSHYEKLRVTDVATLKPEPPVRWFYERMAAVVQAVNKNYRFDLTGFQEAIQFMVYRDSEGGHFGWHLDVGPPVPRKLSLTLQLTDPARYEGGDLQFFTGDMVRMAPKERGIVIGFPSYMVHQVTPVTAGIRKSIVAWVTGPQFR